ncbi:SH3 domain-containing protein [Rhodanobacter umsongensis]|uniref:SH3 domain-containing protein n=1 Tax=Rhodanobacter umsongensis TaxID=633153 RepID=A0ABW0JHX1_9GAMM
MKRLIRSAWISLSLASVSLAASALAHAADGYVTGNVSLRAGPAPDYPLIALIPAGTEVDVLGCTEAWEWCDVIAYGNRGWIAGNYVEYEYEDRPVLLPVYGARIGIPIVTFVIGNYWDSHYRGRPFYRERSRWYRRPIPRRPPPPPVRHPYRPPPHGSPGHGRPPANPPRPISHRPVPGPITPPPGLRPVPGNRPKPSGARPGRDESANRPAGHTMPRPARPTGSAAVPASHRPEPSAGHVLPAGRPSKGKAKAGDEKGDRDKH